MMQANQPPIGKRLRVAVLRDKYQSRFMSPRNSRHQIDSRRFLPFNRASSALDGVTLAAPGRPVDLFHAHNRIPLGVSRFIMSFESNLPRRYALKDDSLILRTMTNAIRSRRCRRLVAMSHFARRCFAHQHREAPYFQELDSKCMVRHPNLALGNRADTLDVNASGPLRLAFVGGHFGRKGGCVAVRIAELARQRNLPIHVSIISTLEAGEAVWTDPTTEDFFAPYFALLDAPNVDFMGAQSNSVVRDTLASCHFSLLPTFADTFGYSAIESMAEHTPVIGTDICALPEFIEDGTNGFLLPMEKTQLGSWKGEDYGARGTIAYARRFAEETDRLAEAALEKLKPYLEDQRELASFRLAARNTAELMFDADRAGDGWDRLYDEVASEPLEIAPNTDGEASTSSPPSYAAARGIVSASPPIQNSHIP